MGPGPMRWRELAGNRPPWVVRRFLIHAETAFLILPVPWAFSSAHSAILARLSHPLCRQRRQDANAAWMRATAGCVRRRPWKSIIVRLRPSARNDVT